MITLSYIMKIYDISIKIYIHNYLLLMINTYFSPNFFNKKFAIYHGHKCSRIDHYNYPCVGATKNVIQV